MARSGEAAALAAPDDRARPPPSKERQMPLVQVKVIEGVFSDDSKRQIVEGLTEAMVAIEGENMRGVTWVIVEEVQSGDWGVGGRALTTRDVQALAAGVSS
jgi:4-oxalocrotonate tautomerase